MENIVLREPLDELLQAARQQRRNRPPIADKLSSVQRELRQRRQALLGSYISARDLFVDENGPNKEAIQVLSKYLANRTVCFWTNKPVDAETVCFRFYRLVFHALCSGQLGRECVDDIFQFSDILVRNRRAFLIAMKDLLPVDMVGELFDFMDSTAQPNFFSPYWGDAVLAGISVFLGVLTDPVKEACDEEG